MEVRIRFWQSALWPFVVLSIKGIFEIDASVLEISVNVK